MLIIYLLFYLLCHVIALSTITIAHTLNTTLTQLRNFSYSNKAAYGCFENAAPNPYSLIPAGRLMSHDHSLHHYPYQIPLTWKLWSRDLVSHFPSARQVSGSTPASGTAACRVAPPQRGQQGSWAVYDPPQVCGKPLWLFPALWSLDHFSGLVGRRPLFPQL